MVTKPAIKTSKKSKSGRPGIAFRIDADMKSTLEGIAAKQNLDPSDIFRLTFYAGLEKLYNFKIEGNKIVERMVSNG